MPGSLIEVSGLLKASHRRSYQEEMESKLVSIHSARFVSYFVATMWCKINEVQGRTLTKENILAGWIGKLNIGYYIKIRLCTPLSVWLLILYTSRKQVDPPPASRNHSR
jgi:hypothetical protein